MPVDMSKYPPEWPQIRAAILERAGHKCERCGIANYTYVVRWTDKDGEGESHYRYAELVDETWYAWNHQTPGGEWEGDPDRLDRKPSKVVLTIAHIHDPTPTNCDPANLQALCQRCHNRLDAPMRAAHARETRRRKVIAATGQQELFRGEL